MLLDVLPEHHSRWVSDLLGVPKHTERYEDHVRKDPCAYCGTRNTARKKKSIDHIVPKYRGGVNTFMNRTAACTKCNNRKKSISLLFFLLEYRHAI